MSALRRIAIVGTGPAGMYACGHLLENRNLNVKVDLFDRLPTPWGLVRAGVAPDHPEKKMIAERLFDCYLQNSKIRFFGNVEVGNAVTHLELAERYDGVIYAVGASGNQSMDLPGESLDGSWSAREFVAWYNGHPDHSGLDFDLSHKRAVIVGNGNVALDVARILTAPLDLLKKTDIADHALHALAESKVEEVVILARRGAAHAAFNNPELEELMHLDSVAVSIEGEDIAAIESEDGTLGWEARRKLVTLKQLAARRLDKPSKSIVFRFLASPQALEGGSQLEQVKLGLNKLSIDGAGVSKAVPTGDNDTLKAGLVLFATGYRGLPLAGLPYDEQRGVVPNSFGRVLDATGQAVPGTYVTGWIKRGPKGVIGTNKQCAMETVASLTADLEAAANQDTIHDDILVLLKDRTISVVDRSDWRKIDRREREAGRPQRRPRVKFIDVSSMQECL